MNCSKRSCIHIKGNKCNRYHIPEKEDPCSGYVERQSCTSDEGDGDGNALCDSAPGPSLSHNEYIYGRTRW